MLGVDEETRYKWSDFIGEKSEVTDKLIGLIGKVKMMEEIYTT